MEESASIKKFKWGKVLVGAGTIFGVVCSISAWVQHGDAILRDAAEGAWTLKITETTYRDMEFTYTVSLTPNGTQVTGKGLKLGEKSLVAGIYTDCKGKVCTPFDIAGSLDRDGDSLEAWFTDEGERSATQLHLVWKPEKSQWVGTFTSEAATSSGPATSSGTASLSRF